MAQQLLSKNRVIRWIFSFVFFLSQTGVFKNESVDFVFSHQLVNNLAPKAREAALSEILRILSVGGEARIYGFDIVRDNLILVRFLEQYFARQSISFEFSERPMVIEHSNPQTTEIHRLYLLKFKKLKSIEPPLTQGNQNLLFED